MKLLDAHKLVTGKKKVNGKIIKSLDKKFMT